MGQSRFHPMESGLTLFTLGSDVARQDIALCGTSAEKSQEESFLHRQALKARRLARVKAGLNSSIEPASAARDVGNIVVMEDTGGVVARRNDFNLDKKTLAFIPVADDAFRVTRRL